MRAFFIFLKVVLGIVVVAVLFVVAVAVYNSFDEELTLEAQAILRPLPMGKVEELNGYIAFLGVSAPKDEDQIAWGRTAAKAYMTQGQPGFTRTLTWQKEITGPLVASNKATQWCRQEEFDCLPVARERSAELDKELADETNALYLKRYRKMREAPQFREIEIGYDPAALWPSYFPVLHGASLARLDTALKFNAGDYEGAVAELEREVSFHRRVVAGNHSLIATLIATAVMNRDLLFVSELLRTGGAPLAPYRPRLQALAAPQLGARVLAEAFAREAQMGLTFARDMRQNMQAKRADTAMAIGLEDELGAPIAWVLSWFVKPNETVNLMAGAHAIEAAVLAAPASGYDAALAKARSERKALLDPLDNGPWYSELRNPVGKMVMLANSPEPFLARYAAKVHDLDALARMVDLQATLADRGITEPAAIAAFVVGEGSKSHPDPFTGRAFAFDPATRQLSFKPRGKGGGLYEGMEKRFKHKNVAIVA